jgi:cytochrome c551/c552
MRTKLLLLGIVWLGGITKIFADPIEDGKTIFMTRCAACHNVNKQLTGPALAGVDQRHSIDWIINFVHSSQKLVTGGDKAAVELFQRFNGVTMPDHPDLTEENIKSIVDYVKSATVIADNKAPFAKPSKLQPYYRPLSIWQDYLVFLVYFFVVVLLIITLLFAVRLKSFSAKAD